MNIQLSSSSATIKDIENAVTSRASHGLRDLVQYTISEMTRRGVSYTAWDVTSFLRRIMGTRHVLPHYDQANGLPGVQPEVHRQMQVYLQNGTYRKTTASPNGKDQAILYVPKATAPPPVSQAQNAASYAPPKSQGQQPQTAPQQLSQNAWVVSSPKPALPDSPKSQGALHPPVVTPTAPSPTAPAAPPAQAAPPKHWKKASGHVQGPDWKEVDRIAQQGRTMVQVEHSCGTRDWQYVWSWAGHGSYVCTGCGQRVRYASLSTACG